MMNGKNVFNLPVKNYLITSENIRKNATNQGDDYTTGCLLEYNYFKNYYYNNRFKQRTSARC